MSEEEPGNSRWLRGSPRHTPSRRVSRELCPARVLIAGHIVPTMSMETPGGALFASVLTHMIYRHVVHSISPACGMDC